MTVTGTVPSFLNGTYYKAIMFNAIAKNGSVTEEGGQLKQLGSVLSVRFSGGGATPTASFGFVRGNDYRAFCYPPPNGPPTGLYASSGAVTVNGACGGGRVCAVTAMPEVVAMDGATLETVAAPNNYTGDSMGKRQIPFPAFAAPGFFMGAHMPADANGDNYGAAYIHDPAPAFRVFRIQHGTNVREVFADLPASPQPGDSGGKAKAASYNHMAMAFTPSFLLLPEMPTRMPVMFDWAAIQRSWIDGGQFFWRVLDKKTGKPLGRYKLPGFWSWHVINAWENATTITVDITWAQNASALNGFVHSAWSPYVGKLARITMPNPLAPGAAVDGVATLTDLTAADDARVPMPEFGVVNPVHMWTRPTRYLWASAAAKRTAASNSFWNTIFRLDTSDGSLATWSPEGSDVPGAPEFVPAAADQAPDSAAGAVLVLTLDGATGQPSLVVLDGETHAVAAKLSLPVAPLASAGLHNHWSPFPTST